MVAIYQGRTLCSLAGTPFPRVFPGPVFDGFLPEKVERGSGE